MQGSQQVVKIGKRKLDNSLEKAKRDEKLKQKAKDKQRRLERTEWEEA